MAYDSFGVNSHPVLCLPPSPVFHYQSLCRVWISASAPTDRTGNKCGLPIRACSHVSIPPPTPDTNPTLLMHLTSIRYHYKSNFSPISGVYFVPSFRKPLLRRFRCNRNLRGEPSSRSLVWHCSLSLHPTPSAAVMMPVGAKCGERQKTRPSSTIIWKSHLAKDLRSVHFRGD